MCQPQKQLLSLLQKSANPLKSTNISLTIKGAYAPPEQWKLTDEANPGIFTYAVKLLGRQIQGGKIEPRKLTEKQLREQQQKNKKGGKKDTKAEQKPLQEVVDPEEQQRKRLQWQALSEQEKFYQTQEDSFKAFSLLFANNKQDFQLDETGISKLEAEIDQDTVELVLIRKPDLSEEDIAKTKKSKPKNLNIAELYEAKYTGNINLKAFQTPGCCSIQQRIKISLKGDIPDDGIKIDAQQCYIYVQISTSEPLSPIVDQIKPPLTQIIPDFPSPSKKTAPCSIQKLKLQICRSIKAISQQYSLFFAKQKQHLDDRKNLNLSSISTLRLNQINKKKQTFLNQFISSGKFNILKQRINKSIKSVVIDKFRKQRTTRKINIQAINKTLSQLNLFFHEEFTKTIDQFLNNTNDSITTCIHEDIVLGYENSKQTRKQVIAPIINESQNQRQQRIASQYQILHQEEKAQQNYVNMLILNDYNIEAKQNYAKFCLKCKKFDQAYVLYSEIAEESNDPKYLLTEAVLLINRKRYCQSSEILCRLIESSETKVASKILYNQLLSFIYELQNNIKQSEKYLSIAERYYKMKQNPNLKFHEPLNPYEQRKPKVPKPERYISQLTHKQSQQIRSNLINYLTSLNLYNLAKIYLQKLQQSDRKFILQIQADIFEQKYDEAITKIDAHLKLLDNIRNIDLLMMKADTCYKAQKMFESQEVFLAILQLKPPSSKALSIYLKLGYTYLHRKSWEDAQIVFEKACQIKYNCSVAWFGLGIANLHLGRYQQAEQALNLTKIYNPLTKQTEEYQEIINFRLSSENEIQHQLSVDIEG